MFIQEICIYDKGNGDIVVEDDNAIEIYEKKDNTIEVCLRILGTVIGRGWVWGKFLPKISRRKVQHDSNVFGLCGNFNGDPDDDFTKQDGTMASDSFAFGDSYRTHMSCQGKTSKIIFTAIV